MLEFVAINGVRTLSRFELSFREGLNVLVGPNGAGKTNILVALDFLAGLAHFRLERAFARHGGLASIATWPNKGRKFGPISFIARGRFALGTHSGGAHQHPKPARDAHFDYIYEITIEIDAADTERISHERLSFLAATPNRGANPVLEVCRVGNSFDVTALDMKRLAGIEWMPSKAAFKQVVKRRGEFSQSQPLIPALESFSYLIHMMTHEFEHLERVNITPEYIRGGDPVGTMPVIQPSGRGLVRTLSALKSGDAKTNSNLTPKAAFERILKRLSLGVEGVRSLNFHRDLDTGRYLGQAGVLRGRSTSKIPLGKLSDGTLKWLALLTQIETADLFAVEEPENFLHPAMQREAVRFLREFTAGKRIVLVTTHSETVVSALRPEELIVVRDIRGRTVASRLRHPDALVEILNQTGFGLGHVYLSGELFDKSALTDAGKG